MEQIAAQNQHLIIDGQGVDVEKIHTLILLVFDLDGENISQVDTKDITCITTRTSMYHVMFSFTFFSIFG